MYNLWLDDFKNSSMSSTPKLSRFTWGTLRFDSIRTLHLNSIRKTKLLFLGTRQMLSRLPEDPRVVFLGTTLKPTDSAKDLGVFLDPHLTYDRHISCVVSSCFAKLCQINRVKRSFDKETLELLIAQLRGPKGRQAEPLKQPIYGRQKETHELIFSWLSWLAVLLVVVYARRRRRRRWSRARWLPYSK